MLWWVNLPDWYALKFQLIGYIILARMLELSVLYDCIREGCANLPNVVSLIMSLVFIKIVIVVLKLNSWLLCFADGRHEQQSIREWTLYNGSETSSTDPALKKCKLYHLLNLLVTLIRITAFAVIVSAPNSSPLIVSSMWMKNWPIHLTPKIPPSELFPKIILWPLYWPVSSSPGPFYVMRPW